MKKLSLFLVALTAVLSLTSCEDEKKPKFHPATSDSFEVYQPSFANQYYELTENGTFEIVCKSAPDYGAPIAPTTYGALVSLDPSFTETQEIQAENNASKVMIKEQYLAEAICKLMGLTKEDAGYEFTKTMPVYLKATCSIKDVAHSYVVSKNYCTLNNVLPYFAIPTPNFIYLVGAPEGWLGPSAGAADHYAEWRLFEKDDEIGSNIYYGTFHINAGEAMFRFYTALTGWDNDSYGSQANDNAKDFAFKDGENTLTMPMEKGKGSYNIPAWEGGDMEICVNMNAPMQVTLTKK